MAAAAPARKRFFVDDDEDEEIRPEGLSSFDLENGRVRASNPTAAALFDDLLDEPAPDNDGFDFDFDFDGGDMDAHLDLEQEIWREQHYGNDGTQEHPSPDEPHEPPAPDEAQEYPNVDDPPPDPLPFPDEEVPTPSMTPSMTPLTPAPPPPHNYRIPPADGGFRMATAANGTPLFLPPRADVYVDPARTDVPLLGRDIYDMLARLEHDALNRASPPSTTPRRRRPADQGQLWVDKYRPRAYLDLVGDETVARDVLAWVRSWDPCVFRAKAPPAKGDMLAFNDPLGRPFRKILLLAGPPGLGKTTLVNVVAKHAGYDITEINASDDRTAAAVADKLANALASTTLHQGQVVTRPRLVLIDEIDGASAHADAGFIKHLVELAMAHPKAKKKSISARKRQQSSGPDLVLKRPIICVCNDLYAPVLRPLRQIAKIVHVRPPSLTSAIAVIRRLGDICDQENLSVDRATMHWLVERAGGDIRSCLNTLQFAKRAAGTSSSNTRRGPVVVTREMLKQADIGSKDQTHSLFGVWDMYFSPAPPAILDVVAAVEANGEFDRLAQGVHEHHATAVRMHEFDRHTRCLDALLDFDRVRRQQYTGSGAHVQDYLPWTLARAHMPLRTGQAVVMGKNRPKVEYPRSEYEAFVRSRDNRSVLGSLAAGANSQLAVSALGGHAPGAWARDVVAPLARILTPPNLRCVNWALMPAAERARVHALVDALHALNLRLIPETVDGVRQYRIEPPINDLCQIAVARGAIKSVLPPSFPVRQMLAQKMNTLSIRVASGIDPEAVLVNTREIAGAKQPRDFFGRPITLTQQERNHHKRIKMDRPLESLRPHAKVVFKFNEGYSNAVRTPLSIRKFMGS